MRFELRHAFLESSKCEPGATKFVGSEDLPLEIAFLKPYIDGSVLAAAEGTARLQGVCAAHALIMSGDISASFYYRKLADHLGLEFVGDWPQIESLDDPASAHRLGCVRLAGSARWLAAPEDDALVSLLRDGASDGPLDDLDLTTPAHLAAIIHYGAQAAVAKAATDALPNRDPRQSAKGAGDTRAGAVAIATSMSAVIGAVYLPWLAGDLLGILFFSGIVARLLISARGLAMPPDEPVELVPDAKLPTYTILAPLHDEAEIVPDLLEALEAIDYPRSKLQVLLLIEPEDVGTRAALLSACLPPWLHVVFGPIGRDLRTKPRALNVGLLMAKGELLTVYDAEDRPDPDQLRRAAAVFAKGPPLLACLQARLSIDNGGESLLARLFAIEYAALFDVLHVGTASLGLPMALGGTSNHFRTSILRDVGGWDAWNVTEDADLGLRLARLGYSVSCLDSTTMEAAPDQLDIWMKQRRRWTKGWVQTLLVLARDAPRVLHRLGWIRSAAVVLLFVNLVAGPLLFPFFCGLLVYDLFVFGIPNPYSTQALVEATLAGSVLLFGVGSMLGLGYAGLKVRGLMAFLPSLPLLIPYQLMISVAAWIGIFDLAYKPYHWHKTPHRPTFRTAASTEAHPSVVHRT